MIYIKNEKELCEKFKSGINKEEDLDFLKNITECFMRCRNYLDDLDKIPDDTYVFISDLISDFDCLKVKNRNIPVFIFPENLKLCLASDVFKKYNMLYNRSQSNLTKKNLDASKFLNKYVKLNCFDDNSYHTQIKKVCDDIYNLLKNNKASTMFLIGFCNKFSEVTKKLRPIPYTIYYNLPYVVKENNKHGTKSISVINIFKDKFFENVKDLNQYYLLEEIVHCNLGFFQELIKMEKNINSYMNYLNNKNNLKYDLNKSGDLEVTFTIPKEQIYECFIK